MGLIGELSDILDRGKEEYKKMPDGEFCVREEILSGAAASSDGGWRNRMGLGDNAVYMKWLLETQDMAGKVRMVYIDPPFFSKASYDAVIRVPEGIADGSGDDKKKTAIRHLAYEDVWGQGLAEYLTMLTSRLFLVRDLLTEDGTIWVHLDWHAVHYVRLLMDEIFGANHFVNEIIWTYKSGGSSKKHFSRKHDTILVYSKSKNYFFRPLTEKSYNRGLKPYHFKGVEEFQDETGWYTMVNMKDVWQIDMVGRTSGERTGYATQKPEALLERILSCCSEPGDLCADFFCGSGTLAAAAQRMGRRWICCDKESLAISAAMKRIISNGKAEQSLVLDEEQPKIAGPDDGPDDGPAADSPAADSPAVGGSLSARQEGSMIRLTGYAPAEDYGRLLDGDGLAAVKKLAGEEALRLIDYWSVDSHYDGMIHRPRAFCFREKEELPLCCEVTDGAAWEDGRQRKGERGISIVAVDILGNRVQCILPELERG